MGDYPATNEEWLALLRAGDVEAFNAAHRQWRTDNPQWVGTRQHGLNFSGVDLHGVNLEGADLRHVRLEYSDLRGANLAKINLEQGSLYGCNLAGASLHEATLFHTSLQHTDLSAAALHDADMYEAFFQDAKFESREQYLCAKSHGAYVTSERELPDDYWAAQVSARTSRGIVGL
jgi:uncharacterized protein YjbI with pentapeptide repeats